MDTAAYLQAIQNAHQALQSGDKSTARRWAGQAAALAPDQEEPWLVLAAVASPRASLAYLERATQINPASPQAANGLRWARQRLIQPVLPPSFSLTPAEVNLPQFELPLSSPQAPVEFHLPYSEPGQIENPRAEKPAGPRPARLSSSFFHVLVPAVVILVLLSLATIAWTGIPPASPALPSHTATTTKPAAARMAAAPVHSPTATPTFFLPATSTFTVTPTFTFTPSPSATLTPTATATATSTSPPTEASTQAPAQRPGQVSASPMPLSEGGVGPSATVKPAAASGSYTVQRGDSLAKIAANLGLPVSALISANDLINPALIFAGQKLVVPQGGVRAAPASAPASVPFSPPAADGKKRIQVSLGEQHLYAYLGDQRVFSFVVSTGRDGGTAAGSFSILDKIPNAYSDPWGFWMPYWMGIYFAGPNLENGFHSLPVLANGQTIWGDSLGTPVSYGCVVLGPQDAKQLFSWADVGTLIEIKP